MKCHRNDQFVKQDGGNVQRNDQNLRQDDGTAKWQTPVEVFEQDCSGYTGTMSHHSRGHDEWHGKVRSH